MFKKILIANRGEIAIRVARSAKSLGVRTVAVYSDADRNAPHVRACDEAVHIGPSAAAQSYLVADKIIAAAKQTGAEAIHPGYGFLSENADFAEALEREGLVFIGPTAKTIRAMGSKSAAKDLMEAAGVPTTPGYQGADQKLATFKTEAKRIGYPVLLKATAGGGGKGMRRVNKESELEAALASAQREAKSAFGDDRFLIEKYIETARHLEVQIFGDGKGEVVHFFERDCSVQRRHQKVIEEAPAPNLPPRVRKALLKAGVDAGRAVDYRGAGTVEFLYDGQDNVYFMEMNTRLQVEHPVSELITGLDLVEWQLRVASGEALPLKQGQIKETGHAFEARLYAENPVQDFAPSIGRVTALHLPEGLARIDSGVAEGQEISPYYDPMIAKIITHGSDRMQSLSRLRDALARTRVAGLETNSAFLYALANHPAFIGEEVSTRFIEDHGAALFAAKHALETFWAAAIIWLGAGSPMSKSDPWSALEGFRLNHARQTKMWIEHEGQAALLNIVQDEELIHVTLERDASAQARRDGHEALERLSFAFSGEMTASGDIIIHIDGARFTAQAGAHDNGVRVWIDGTYQDVALADPLSGNATSQAAAGSLTAPMAGIITLLSASPGDKVAAGDTLLVMEAMKMEHTIRAPTDGVLKAYRFAKGDQVKDGELLVEIEDMA